MFLLGLAIALVLALHIAIAILLVRKYLGTRDVSFIWLGVAVVIWPLVSSFLGAGQRILVDSFSTQQPLGVFLAHMFPFSLVKGGKITLGALVSTLDISRELSGAALLLVAILYLCKTKRIAPAHLQS